jgi:K+-transporting ATPase ATPase C chain
MISLKIFLVMTILTGLVYPFLITGIARVAFPGTANGSLVFKDNKAVGSELIGQLFDSTIYFSSRPSVIGYNPLPSGGSNYGLSNSKLINQVSERRSRFITFNSLDSLRVIPSEMLFASASGLDPHISPTAALLQVNRIVKARHFDINKRDKLIETINELKEMPQYFVFGEDRINVLLLNIELDKI